MSEIREITNKVLEAYNQLAKLNINQGWIDRVWKSIHWYIKEKIIPKKSDQQLEQEMYVIYKVMNPYFKRFDMNDEIEEGEKLSGINIIPVGQLFKDKNLVKLTEQEKKKALEVYESIKASL